MAPRKKAMSKEERLRRKRLAERERYAKLKNDPERWKQRQDALAENYTQRKAAGKVKMVAQMTRRELRAKRKQWRENSRASKAKKDQQKKGEKFLRENSPAESDAAAEALPQPIDNVPRPQISSGRKRMRRDRAKVVRENAKLRQSVQKLTQNVEKYKKRWMRLKNASSSNIESPNKKVKKVLASGIKAIKRRLILAETLNHNLSQKYQSIRSHKKKQLFRTFVAGNKTYLWKYKLMNEFRQINEGLFTTRGQLRNRNSVMDSNSRTLAKHIQCDVIRFYEQDDVSRISPGKKDSIVRAKVKKQKRLLSASLQELHKRFCDTHPYKISYALFCKLRPFWVLVPKTADRETCKCVIHENLALMLDALHRAKVIPYSDTNSVLRQLCCDEFKAACLLRKCSLCVDNVIQYNEFDGQEPVTYYQWLYKTGSFIDKKTGKERFVKRVAKDKLQANKYDLVLQLESKLGSFLKHEGTMKHQYLQIRQLKSNLRPNEVLIHVDFSENYCCKYGTEIQSFHFGGSRAQISLHTVVVYYKTDEYAPITTKSICTLSKCLDHNAPAIWAHLQPIFDFVKSTKPQLKYLHFLSDGPSNQYKNKTMFYLIGHVLKEFFPAVEISTWNYHETGHGKGAVDGVGARVKQHADAAVAHGADIDSFEALMEELKKLRNILIIEVGEEEILKMSECIPKNLKAFRGTMSIHQVVYNSKTLDTVKFNSLSCFSCYDCENFKLGSLTVADQTTENMEDVLHPIYNVQVTLDEDYEEGGESDRQEPPLDMDKPTPFLQGDELKLDDFVLVKFLAKKKFIFYVGKVIKKYSNTDFDVSFMRKKTDYFVFPKVADTSSVISSDVLAILGTPKNMGRDRYAFKEDLEGFAIR